MFYPAKSTFYCAFLAICKDKDNEKVEVHPGTTDDTNHHPISLIRTYSLFFFLATAS